MFLLRLLRDFFSWVQPGLAKRKEIHSIMNFFMIRGCQDTCTRDLGKKYSSEDFYVDEFKYIESGSIWWYTVWIFFPFSPTCKFPLLGPSSKEARAPCFASPPHLTILCTYVLLGGIPSWIFQLNARTTPKISNWNLSKSQLDAKQHELT